MPSKCQNPKAIVIEYNNSWDKCIKSILPLSKVDKVSSKHSLPFNTNLSLKIAIPSSSSRLEK